jgi:AcrR family transcriptional regulator
MCKDLVEEADSVRTVGDDRVQTTDEALAAGAYRQRLLDGLTAAIRERGFRESTIADIVRQARTSRRTFYEYFDSKQSCFVALLREMNAEVIRRIRAAVDPHAPWPDQIRQAIEAWIAAQQAEPALTLAWIREVPSLGADARHLQRETMEAFIVLIQALTDTPDLRAAGITPPPRQFAVMLLGGLRELIATTVEDGADIASIVDVAVDATTALLGPRP